MRPAGRQFDMPILGSVKMVLRANETKIRYDLCHNSYHNDFGVLKGFVYIFYGSIKGISQFNWSVETKG